VLITFSKRANNEEARVNIQKIHICVGMQKKGVNKNKYLNLNPA